LGKEAVFQEFLYLLGLIRRLYFKRGNLNLLVDAFAFYPAFNEKEQCKDNAGKNKAKSQCNMNLHFRHLFTASCTMKFY